MAITLPGASSATISTTEYYLFSQSTTATWQTATAFFQAFISFANMVAGDSYRVRVYLKINSVVHTLEDTTVSGVQSTPYMTLQYPGGGSAAAYEVSVIRTAGSDRSISWHTVLVA